MSITFNNNRALANLNGSGAVNKTAPIGNFISALFVPPRIHSNDQAYVGCYFTATYSGVTFNDRINMVGIAKMINRATQGVAVTNDEYQRFSGTSEQSTITIPKERILKFCRDKGFGGKQFQNWIAAYTKTGVGSNDILLKDFGEEVCRRSGVPQGPGFSTTLRSISAFATQEVPTPITTIMQRYSVWNGTPVALRGSENLSNEGFKGLSKTERDELQEKANAEQKIFEDGVMAIEGSEVEAWVSTLRNNMVLAKSKLKEITDAGREATEKEYKEIFKDTFYTIARKDYLIHVGIDPESGQVIKTISRNSGNTENNFRYIGTDTKGAQPNNFYTNPSDALPTGKQPTENKIN